MTIHVKNNERRKFIWEIWGRDYLYPSSLRKHQETEHPEETKEKQPEPVPEVASPPKVKHQAKIEFEEEDKEEEKLNDGKESPNELNIEDLYKQDMLNAGEIDFCS